ncbi:hypothetical protein LPJ64_001180 [Coemansia asiatica]|uniref:Uncharacterized protein n=1 Tax=Coemansia asiatica TaxID=1052880 RepID=A0A9W7XQK4_9FUNG|nr:hypothetical protein LPJ64_001180 [Coemansia asiatica]
MISAMQSSMTSESNDTASIATSSSELTQQQGSVEAATSASDVDRLLSMVNSAQNSKVIRYSTEQLLALRESRLIRPPENFSPYTPLRPGSQVNLPEIASAIGDAKAQQGSQYIGLEHIVRNHKDIGLQQQHQQQQQHRSANHSHNHSHSNRHQSSMQRMFGTGRGPGINSANSGTGGQPDSSGNGHGHGGQRHMGPPSSVGAQGGRGHQGRSGSTTGAHSGSRSYNNINSNSNNQGGANGGSDGGRASGGSWRSSGTPRAPGNASGRLLANSASNYRHSNIGDANDGGQPEWMNDELTYDENQSAKQMHDMEEWKRSMKEGGPTGVDMLNESNYLANQHQVGSIEINGEKSDMARGSRFLRLFSASDSSASANGGINVNSGAALAVPGGMASGHGSSMLNHHHHQQQQQQQQHSGDQISKLYKVFGDKLSIGSGPVPNNWAMQEPQDGASVLEMQNAQALSNMHAAESMRMAMLMQATGGTNIQQQQSTAMTSAASTMPATEAAPASTSQAIPSSAVAATTVVTQTIKTASPAPINEALRGIVPTSVFRKSVHNNNSSGNCSNGSTSSHAGGVQKRPDSTSSSRSGTPARNLPSWLVELSRGSTSPSGDQASSKVITNESLGSQDLVDTLEREFPALNVKPRQTDNQSISSLSVQASVGVPSETNGGSIRRGSIDTTHSSERIVAPSVPGTASTASITSEPAASAVTAASNGTAGPAIPMQQMAPPVPPMSNMTMPAPEVLQQMQQHGILGMLPPHMMIPEGAMIPGLVPPMGMIPPQHAMGFHPNMMFGMMPPPPPGMFGGMPPVSLPMGQMAAMPNGMAGPGSGPGSGPGPLPVPVPVPVPAGLGHNGDHQQMLMKMMMMSEVPPGMMYGQLPGAPPPHMYSAGVPYAGVPMQMPASNEPSVSAAIAQSPNQLHPQQQQQQ